MKYLLILFCLIRGLSPELFADAASTAKDDKLTPVVPPQIEIESKFIEVPDAVAKELTFPGRTSFMDNFPGAAPRDETSRTWTPGKVLNEKDAEELLRKLSSLEGVDLLSGPRVTTRSRKRAVIECIREFRYPTEYERDEKQPGRPVTPTAFETRNCGVTLDVEPRLGEGDTIDLKVTSEVTDFLGFISYPSGEAMPVEREPGEKLAERVGLPKITGKPYAPDEIRQPIFSTRKTTAEVTIYSGQTIVFLGISGAEPMKGFDLPSAGKQLMVLVRASIMKPEDPAASQSEGVPSPPAVSDIPAGTAVPNKPGFVTSHTRQSPVTSTCGVSTRGAK